MLGVSVARTGALLRNYSGPMAIFRALPEVRSAAATPFAVLHPSFYRRCQTLLPPVRDFIYVLLTVLLADATGWGDQRSDTERVHRR